jgi:hypothetical protein
MRAPVPRAEESVVAARQPEGLIGRRVLCLLRGYVEQRRVGGGAEAELPGRVRIETVA